jgi:hypothetical protein
VRLAHAAMLTTGSPTVADPRQPACAHENAENMSQQQAVSAPSLEWRRTEQQQEAAAQSFRCKGFITKVPDSEESTDQGCTDLLVGSIARGADHACPESHSPSTFAQPAVEKRAYRCLSQAQATNNSPLGAATSQVSELEPEGACVPTVTTVTAAGSPSAAALDTDQSNDAACVPAAEEVQKPLLPAWAEDETEYVFIPATQIFSHSDDGGGGASESLEATALEACHPLDGVDVGDTGASTLPSGVDQACAVGADPDEGLQAATEKCAAQPRVIVERTGLGGAVLKERVEGASAVSKVACLNVITALHTCKGTTAEEVESLVVHDSVNGSLHLSGSLLHSRGACACASCDRTKAASGTWLDSTQPPCATQCEPMQCIDVAVGDPLAMQGCPTRAATDAGADAAGKTSAHEQAKILPSAGPMCDRPSTECDGVPPSAAGTPLLPPAMPRSMGPTQGTACESPTQQLGSCERGGSHVLCRWRPRESDCLGTIVDSQSDSDALLLSSPGRTQAPQHSIPTRLAVRGMGNSEGARASLIAKALTAARTASPSVGEAVATCARAAGTGGADDAAVDVPAASQAMTPTAGAATRSHTPYTELLRSSAARVLGCSKFVIIQNTEETDGGCGPASGLTAARQVREGTLPLPARASPPPNEPGTAFEREFVQPPHPAVAPLHAACVVRRGVEESRLCAPSVGVLRQVPRPVAQGNADGLTREVAGKGGVAWPVDQSTVNDGTPDHQGAGRHSGQGGVKGELGQNPRDAAKAKAGGQDVSAQTGVSASAASGVFTAVAAGARTAHDSNTQHDSTVLGVAPPDVPIRRPAAPSTTSDAGAAAADAAGAHGHPSCAGSVWTVPETVSNGGQRGGSRAGAGDASQQVRYCRHIVLVRCRIS